MDVVCIGEMLIDFICQDIEKSIEQGEIFSKKAGGAPANVAAAVAKLGGESLFAGKVGNDSFGRFLKNVLSDVSVDTSNMILDKKYKTSLAFVSLKKDGERDFEFIREPGADTMLKYNELNEEKIYSAKIIHYGSISLISGTTKETLIKILKKAKESGIVISYDPNLRLNLWESPEHAKRGILEGMVYADIVKVSEEELEFITNKKYDGGGIVELHKMGAKIVFITRGKDGAIVSNGKDIIVEKGMTVKAVDATGAGDGFTGGYLYKLSRYDDIIKKAESSEILKETIEFANKVGAIATTKYGAISALPTLDEVEIF